MAAVMIVAAVAAAEAAVMNCLLSARPPARPSVGSVRYADGPVGARPTRGVYTRSISDEFRLLAPPLPGNLRTTPVAHRLVSPCLAPSSLSIAH